MKEEWRPIPDSNGKYEVSNAGAIRSTTRIINKVHHASGKVTAFRHKGRVLRLHLDRSNGYLGQLLERKLVRAHRAVWEAHIGPIPKGMQINHKNGIKTDNRLENLEIVTGKENTIHALNSRLSWRNRRKPLLTDEDIRAIRFFMEAGKAKRYERGSEISRTLAKVFDRPQQTIYRIALRKGYAHVK